MNLSKDYESYFTTSKTKSLCFAYSFYEIDIEIFLQ